jgi:hypothetical protein
MNAALGGASSLNSEGDGAFARSSTGGARSSGAPSDSCRF